MRCVSFNLQLPPFAMARCQLVDWSNAERMIKEAFWAEQVLLELFEHLKFALRQQQGKSERFTCPKAAAMS